MNATQQTLVGDNKRELRVLIEMVYKIEHRVRHGKRGAEHRLKYKFLICCNSEVKEVLILLITNKDINIANYSRFITNL